MNSSLNRSNEAEINGNFNKLESCGSKYPKKQKINKHKKILRWLLSSLLLEVEKVKLKIMTI